MTGGGLRHTGQLHPQHPPLPPLQVYPGVEMQYERREVGYATLGSYIDGDNGDAGSGVAGVRFCYTQPVVMLYSPPVRLHGGAMAKGQRLLCYFCFIPVFYDDE